MENLVFDNITPSDYEWLNGVNNKSAPAMNEMSMVEMVSLIDRSSVARIARVEGDSVGALIAFLPNKNYDSSNYQWFNQNYSDFLYIDRAMVEEDYRGAGIGKKLYSDTIRVAKELGVSSITCEVNTKPPNLRSMEFHKRQGFVLLENRHNALDNKHVAMLSLPLEVV